MSRLNVCSVVFFFRCLSFFFLVFDAANHLRADTNTNRRPADLSAAKVCVGRMKFFRRKTSKK